MAEAFQFHVSLGISFLGRGLGVFKEVLFVHCKKKKKSNTSQERLHSRRNEGLSQVKMQTQIYFKNYPVNLKLVEDGPYPRPLNASFWPRGCQLHGLWHSEVGTPAPALSPLCF